MPFTEPIQLITDLEIPITEVSEIIPITVVSEIPIQMVVSDRETLEVSETVIPVASEIHSLLEDSVILFLSQDQIISHSQDITTAASDQEIPVASDPVEDSTPVAASEAVLPAAAVSDPEAAVEVASDNCSN